MDESTQLNANSPSLSNDLSKLECPYTWDIGIGSMDHLSSNIETFTRKVKEDEHGEDETILSVTIYLALSEEYTRAGDFQSALTSLDKAFEKSKLDNLYLFKEALQYVISAQRAHIFYLKGDVNQVVEELKKCSEELKHNLKYVLKGIQGAVGREYGLHNAKMCFREAIEFDTCQKRKGEWYFMYSNLLNRERHELPASIPPTEEEIDALERAQELLQTPSSKLFLASVYLDKSRSLYFSGNDTYVVDELNKTAFDITMDALRKSENHPRLLLKCSSILLRLPGKYRKKDLAERALKDALALSPDNPMANHMLAIFYEFQKKDLLTAKLYYEKAANHKIVRASVSLISVRWRLNRSQYDPLPELKRLLQEYSEDSSKSLILIQIGAYYWFVKKNLTEATKAVIDALKLVPEMQQMKYHFCVFGPFNANILETLEKELHYALKQDLDNYSKKEYFRESLRQLGEFKCKKTEEN